MSFRAPMTRGAAKTGRNVTATDDLLPISAPLAVHDRSTLKVKVIKGFPMTTMRAETAQDTQHDTQQGTQSAQKHQGGRTPLVHCYGKIGIPAVAAAARYQGAGKNPAYAPVAVNADRSRADEAA